MTEQRAWKVAAFVALAALLAGLVTPAIRAHRGTADPEGNAQKPTAASVAMAGNNAAAPATASQPAMNDGSPEALPKKAETPEDIERKAKVARAMDLSSIRSLILTLKTSTIDENTAIRSSTLLALKRYGATARPLLQEEFDHSQDEKVRRSLEEALASAQ